MYPQSHHVNYKNQRCKTVNKIRLKMIAHPCQNRIRCLVSRLQNLRLKNYCWERWISLVKKGKKAFSNKHLLPIHDKSRFTRSKISCPLTRQRSKTINLPKLSANSNLSIKLKKFLSIVAMYPPSITMKPSIIKTTGILGFQLLALEAKE